MDKRKEAPRILVFESLKERSQRIIYGIVAGLVLYWTLGSLLFVQVAFWFHAAIFRLESGWISAQAVLCTLPASITLALVHYFWATAGVARRVCEIFLAQKLDPGDPYHILFRNTVEEIRIATGNALPIQCVVLPWPSLNGLSIRTPKGEAIVGVTEGLLARARREEIQAVVAQLTGQILTCDALVSTVAFSLFGSIEEEIDKVLDAADDSGPQGQRVGGIFLSFLVLAKGFLRLGHFVNLFLSRERVFRSDAVAVELTRNPVALAQALRRLEFAWRGSGSFGDGTEAILFVPLGRGRHDAQMGFFQFLFRCHPPLSDRLRRALGMAGRSLISIDEVITAPVAQRGFAASPTTPGPPASPRGLASDTGEGAFPPGGVQAAAPEPVPAEEGPTAGLWIAHHEGAWQGPFALAALRKLAWLGPATLVSRKGLGEIIPAGKDATLRRALFEGGGSHRCPRCTQSLAENAYEGVPIHACRACGGKLVPEDGLQRVLIRRIFEVGPELRDRMARWKGAHSVRPPRRRQNDYPDLLACPLCGDRMMRAFYSSEYFVEVDRCFRCKVTWFDGGELELLQALVETATDRIDARHTSQGA